jgi:uncharacterized membrane protein
VLGLFILKRRYTVSQQLWGFVLIAPIAVSGLTTFGRYRRNKFFETWPA